MAGMGTLKLFRNKVNPKGPSLAQPCATNFGSRESRILQWREWFPQTSNLNHQKSEFRGKLYEAVGL